MSDTTFRVDVEADEGFLRFRVSGVLTAASDRAIDERVVYECRHRGFGAALVDIRGAEGRLSILENYNAAATFHARVTERVRRVAILDLPEHRDRSEFFENAAVNRNARVRSFEDEADAVAWLRAESQ